MRSRPPLRFGIIGLGVAGVGAVGSLAHHPNVRITACAEPRREAREQFARDFEAEPYEGAEQLCQSPNVDAVYVATPHWLHAPNVIAAAQSGKHAICEKPMALSLEDCDAMIAAVERAGTRLVVGHSAGFDPPVLKIREIVRSGELGRVGMINHFSYKGFFYGPMRPDELDPSQGGGAVLNQGPHQIDLVRWIGGGMVRSVRSTVGIWDPARPVEGAHATFMEFEDGATAIVVLNAYDHFDSDEFHFWVGQGGLPVKPETYGERRRMVTGMTRAQETAMKAERGYGGSARRTHEEGGVLLHPHYGVTIVSCERADLRPSPTGVLVYDDNGRREIPVAPEPSPRANVIDELCDAVLYDRYDRSNPHDGRWGKATLEVCLAILQSAGERREVTLSHQVPTPD